jgi:hypothetical protein
LTNRLRITEFEKEQLLQKTLFLQEQMESRASSSSSLAVRCDDHRSSSSFHPYTRVERSGNSREASPGPDHHRRVIHPSASYARILTAPTTPPMARPVVSQDVPMVDAAHTLVPPPLAYTTSSDSAPSQLATSHPAPTQLVYTPAPLSTSTSVRLTARNLRVDPPPASAPQPTTGPTFEQDPYKWSDQQGDDEDERDNWDNDDDDGFERREYNRQTRVLNRAAWKQGKKKAT